jgi:hypothetical protein
VSGLLPISLLPAKAVGKVVGTTTKFGEAFSFERTDDFVSIPDRTFGPALTMDAWINIDNTGTLITVYNGI